jgi:hypothetical protein
MMVIAVFCLNIGHPGIVFDREPRNDMEMSYTYTGNNGAMLEPKLPASSSE